MQRCSPWLFLVLLSFGGSALVAQDSVKPALSSEQIALAIQDGPSKKDIKPYRIGKRASLARNNMALEIGPAYTPYAQTPLTSGSEYTFEVASVKANKSGVRTIRRGFLASGRFEAVNLPLIDLIRAAYDIESFQISGAPAWFSSDRFDISAKADEKDLDPTDLRRRIQQLKLMLRSLLRERFKLGVHPETRELPVFALVMARTDKRMGPALKRHVECAASPSSADCAPSRDSVAGAGGPDTGVTSSVSRTSRPYEMTFSYGGAPISQLASNLTKTLGRLVIDRTGLEGSFDLSLGWNSDAPVIYTAIQEQLGLRLQSTTGPVEILVIDGADQPTPD